MQPGQIETIIRVLISIDTALKKIARWAEENTNDQRQQKTGSQTA